MDERREFLLNLKKEIDKKVIGQAEYKKILALHVAELLFEGKTSPILVMGPTGSGKTHTIRALEHSNELKRHGGFTIYTCDATTLSGAGYSGDDFSNIMRQYKRLCSKEGNIDLRGIIFVDEFDKVCSKSFSSDGQNTNHTVQASILTALEPSCSIFGFDTSKILFVFAGAFTDFYEQLTKKKSKQTLGFSQKELSKETALENNIIIREELIEYGCMREILGRISDIVQLRDLNFTQLATILSHPKSGYIPEMQKNYASYGLELMFQPQMNQLIVERIQKERLGARGVKTVVNSLLSTTLFDALEANAQRVIIHPGMFEGESPVFENEDEKWLLTTS